MAISGSLGWERFSFALRIILICNPCQVFFRVLKEVEHCVISEETARSVYRVEIEGSRIDDTLEIDFNTTKIEDRDGCLVFVSIFNHDLSE